MNDYVVIGPNSWALFQEALVSIQPSYWNEATHKEWYKHMSKLQRMNSSNRSTERGRGPYHDNNHVDGPAGGNPTGVVQGKSVKQGRSDEPATVNQGYTGKVSK